MIDKRGDHKTVANELLNGVSEIYQKCRVIDMIIKDGDFSLQEALLIYKVTLQEYIEYEKERVISFC
jgi:hypothetical protein